MPLMYLGTVLLLAFVMGDAGGLITALVMGGLCWAAAEAAANRQPIRRHKARLASARRKLAKCQSPTQRKRLEAEIDHLVDHPAQPHKPGGLGSLIGLLAGLIGFQNPATGLVILAWATTLWITSYW